ncbi:MAG: NAD(P)/FAD-dependent oxidoreductase, partial [Syntrophobacterales bacterium]|nr:NAD(P)/FAD-dependent oxidoreductase [Syntrophobacterales bacterium]
MAEQYDVVVIGGGASGLMAAGRAAEKGARVLLLEKMAHPGKKLLLSGKTRCNLSNIKDLKEFIAMFGNNGSFLYRALHVFSRENLLSMLRSYGVETKVERGGRIFPVSDNAEDVLRALCRFAAESRAGLRTNVHVRGIDVKDGKIMGVRTDQYHVAARAVVLAAGGGTYPLTGSTGDGYKMASAIGHTVEPIYPALVPLVVKETGQAASMQGISLKNVRLTSFACPSDQIDLSMVPSCEVGRGLSAKKIHPAVIESRMGEMMMTHFGL